MGHQGPIYGCATEAVRWDSELGLYSAIAILKFVLIFEQWALHFHFPSALPIYVSSPGGHVWEKRTSEIWLCSKGPTSTEKPP